jgi:hypothetical protein
VTQKLPTIVVPLVPMVLNYWYTLRRSELSMGLMSSKLSIPCDTDSLAKPPVEVKEPSFVNAILKPSLLVF